MSKMSALTLFLAVVRTYPRFQTPMIVDVHQERSRDPAQRRRRNRRSRTVRKLGPMEVIRVTTEGNECRSDDGRERLIGKLLKRRVGIFGTEICQLCGDLGSFSGWISAWASHHGPTRDFVDSAHGHGPHGEHAVALARQAHRFCGRCARRTSRGDLLRSGRRLCENCRSELEQAHPAADLDQLLAPLARRRHLERKTTVELRELDASLASAELDHKLDEATGLERLVLEASRGRRAREELARLSELHGVDYLGDS